MPGPGPLNLITDVAGLKVGNAEDPRVRTGTTVVLPDARCICAVDTRGGAPGTRDTDALNPDTLVDEVDAVILSGGSVYGLAAADGVTAWLGAQGRGFGMVERPGVPRAPITPTAILYDLANTGDKAWGETPPYRALGRAAALNADTLFGLGNVGAGLGARAGALEGGLGSASFVASSGFTVGALVAVNSFGSVMAPGDSGFWAAPFEIGAEFGGRDAPQHADPEDWGLAKASGAMAENTTIAIVATDAALTPAQARRVAIMAHDGMARAIRPVHTPWDGDVIFCLSTGHRPGPVTPQILTQLGSLAADTLARAIARGVYEARS